MAEQAIEAQVIECTVDGCHWSHLRVALPSAPAALAAVFGGGVLDAIARASELEDTERALRQHMATHRPEEFLRTITRLRARVAELEASRG